MKEKRVRNGPLSFQTIIRLMKDACHFCSQPIRGSAKYVPKRDDDGLIRDKLICDRCQVVYDLVIKTRPELFSRGRVLDNEIDREAD